MDSRGFLSIKYLFSIFLILLISTGLLLIAQTSFNSVENIEKHASYKIVLDEMTNDINQVNSKGPGYSKTITMPDNIAHSNYHLQASKNKVTLHINGYLAESRYFTTYLVNDDDKKLQEFILYSGASYIITKLDNSTISIKRIS